MELDSGAVTILRIFFTFEKYNRFTIENAAFFREYTINMTLEKKKNGYNEKV